MLGETEIFALLFAALAGVLLGVFYFGGLWWTVRRMPQVRQPLQLYFGSLGVRLTVVLIIFFGVTVRYGWPELLALFATFIVVRSVMIRVLGRTASLPPPAQDSAG